MFIVVLLLSLSDSAPSAATALPIHVIISLNAFCNFTDISRNWSLNAHDFN
jgi:hypothetical protein